MVSSFLNYRMPEKHRHPVNCRVLILDIQNLLTLPGGKTSLHYREGKKDRETICAAIDHSDIRGLGTAGQWDRRELASVSRWRIDVDIASESYRGFSVIAGVSLSIFSLPTGILNLFYRTIRAPGL